MLTAEVDVEEVEADDDSGIEIGTLTILANDFFFLVGGRAIEVEVVRSSPRAFLNFPSYLFFSI